MSIRLLQNLCQFNNPHKYGYQHSKAGNTRSGIYLPRYSEGYAISSKKCSCTVAISEVTASIFNKFANNAVTILPLNIYESELPYSYPFQNASLPNEGHFANFAVNWLPWQRPLRNRKKRPRSIIW